jgi:hypothetical protein
MNILEGQVGNRICFSTDQLSSCSPRLLLFTDLDKNGRSTEHDLRAPATVWVDHTANGSRISGAEGASVSLPIDCDQDAMSAIEARADRLASRMKRLAEVVGDGMPRFGRGGTYFSCDTLRPLSMVHAVPPPAAMCFAESNTVCTKAPDEPAASPHEADAPPAPTPMLRRKGLWRTNEDVGGDVTASRKYMWKIHTESVGGEVASKARPCAADMLNDIDSIGDLSARVGGGTVRPSPQGHFGTSPASKGDGGVQPSLQAQSDQPVGRGVADARDAPSITRTHRSPHSVPPIAATLAGTAP